MKIICAPDSFKQSLSAVDASRAMFDGARSAVPDLACDRCPVGDGGEGTLAALRESLDGRLIKLPAHDPFGAAIRAEVAHWTETAAIYIESASVIGMQIVPVERRDILQASSRGVGELIAGVLEREPARIIVGVGGSVTNDGGCGMAQALGIRFLDTAGNAIETPIAGGMLGDIAAIDMRRRNPKLAGVEVIAACDVQNPLTGANGAARIYAPQKGASAADVDVLEAGLANLVRIIERDIGIDIAELAGGGAAGGLGAGLVAFAGAKIVSGIEFVLERLRFGERVRDADLCLTGEGRLDAQSLSGKACLGVAEVAARHGVPVVALVGSAGDGAERCLAAGLDGYRVIAPDMPLNEAIARAAELLEAASAAVVSEYRDRAEKR